MASATAVELVGSTKRPPPARRGRAQIADLRARPPMARAFAMAWGPARLASHHPAGRTFAPESSARILARPAATARVRPTAPAAAVFHERHLGLSARTSMSVQVFPCAVVGVAQRHAPVPSRVSRTSSKMQASTPWMFQHGAAVEFNGIKTTLTAVRTPDRFDRSRPTVRRLSALPWLAALLHVRFLDQDQQLQLRLRNELLHRARLHRHSHVCGEYRRRTDHSKLGLSIGFDPGSGKRRQLSGVLRYERRSFRQVHSFAGVQILEVGAVSRARRRRAACRARTGSGPRRWATGAARVGSSHL